MGQYTVLYAQEVLAHLYSKLLFERLFLTYSILPCTLAHLEIRLGRGGGDLVISFFTLNPTISYKNFEIQETLLEI